MWSLKGHLNKYALSNYINGKLTIEMGLYSWKNWMGRRLL